MSGDSNDGFAERAKARRENAVGPTGTGFPEQEYQLLKTPEESARSMEYLWELSCFTYGGPCNKAIDKSIGKTGFGTPP